MIPLFMSPNKEEQIEHLIDFGKKVATKNLIWANSGNISYRLTEISFIISGSGAHLAELKNDDFVVLDLEGNVLEGEKKPSIESKMHSAIYRAKPESSSVFHSQAFFTTLISCTDFEVKADLFPESMAYLKTICRVSYNHPGSKELAEDVAKVISDCDILILNNHGAICAGSSLSDILLKTETLEMLCKMIVFSRVSDLNLNFLPWELKEDFLEHLKQIKDSM
jgi:L-fuculose-phosphate aldolase